MSVTFFGQFLVQRGEIDVQVAGRLRLGDAVVACGHLEAYLADGLGEFLNVVGGNAVA